jgi:hypothetical protein
MHDVWASAPRQVLLRVRITPVHLRGVILPVMYTSCVHCLCEDVFTFIEFSSDRLKNKTPIPQRILGWRPAMSGNTVDTI